MSESKKVGCSAKISLLRSLGVTKNTFFSFQSQTKAQCLTSHNSLIFLFSQSIFCSQWAAYMTLSGLLPVALSQSLSSSTVWDTIKHLFLLEIAGWFSANPSKLHLLSLLGHNLSSGWPQHALTPPEFYTSSSPHPNYLGHSLSCRCQLCAS